MKKIVAVLLSALMVFAFFGCSKKAAVDETTTTNPITEVQTEPAKEPSTSNPLTGDDQFNAVGKRPVALVVENLSPARPQWGIESPDIICEGEVEGGISRMLWLYADIDKVPEKVGPLRSARTSYVEFSQFFDSIFIHWGGSHSKDGYIGGYGMIKRLKVNNIDGMNGGKMFGRDKTRKVSSEHRSILDGSKIKATIKDKGYRTDLKETGMTKFSFNDQVVDAGDAAATSVKVTFSDRTDTRAFAYNTSDNNYHTNDWKTDVKFQNVIVLSAPSKYISVTYKKGSKAGQSVTYLNYDWTKGGKGYYASNGKGTEISWQVVDNKLVLKDANGAELNINKGKSYIGFVSSNHNGKVTMA